MVYLLGYFFGRLRHEIGWTNEQQRNKIPRNVEIRFTTFWLTYCILIGKILSYEL